MSHARLLAGKVIVLVGISQGLNGGQKGLWSKYKEVKNIIPSARVSIQYPARLVVNGYVACDIFPDWGTVAKDTQCDLNLKIASLNVCGIKSRSEFPDFCSCIQKFDICWCSETKTAAN